MATLAELQTELAEIKQAITNIRLGGQSYTITSGTGGNSRTVTQADYNSLIADKNRLEAQIANMQNRRAVKFRAGW
jgi:hypothetical protein